MNQTDASSRPASFRPVLAASVVLFLSLLAVAGAKSYHDLEAARQRRLTLETRIRATETEISRLHNRIDRLRSDPGLLERLAREDLGMVRPGDVVVELPLEDAGETAPPPPRSQPPQPPLEITPAPAPAPAPSPATVTPAAGSAAPPAPWDAAPHPAATASGPPAPASP